MTTAREIHSFPNHYFSFLSWFCFVFFWDNSKINTKWLGHKWILSLKGSSVHTPPWCLKSGARRKAEASLPTQPSFRPSQQSTSELRSIKGLLQDKPQAPGGWDELSQSPLELNWLWAENPSTSSCRTACRRKLQGWVCHTQQVVCEQRHKPGIVPGAGWQPRSSLIELTFHRGRKKRKSKMNDKLHRHLENFKTLHVVIYLGVHVYVHMSEDRDVRSPGAGITDRAARWGAGNRTQVLWKNSMCS